ncbi:hypothetical protein DDT56_00900 [Brenneria corticis]|uniref:YdgH/BhsA/McbA-like domain-containing protein n=1 Tax=Brenneria corticis TaxID=2173106 RepID=A0A2U1UDL0_9GAMM|nr:hypothetical protein DDT56_00900 [Brenneria sp. CFCC 11842]
MSIWRIPRRCARWKRPEKPSPIGIFRRGKCRRAEAGARAFTITSANGDNQLRGTAVIYN